MIRETAQPGNQRCTVNAPFAVKLVRSDGIFNREPQQVLRPGINNDAVQCISHEQCFRQ